MNHLALVLVLSLAPLAVLAQPPPARTGVVVQRSTSRQSPILAASLRQKDSRTISRTDRAKRLQPRRLRSSVVVHHPSPLHLLGTSLQDLPPPLPPALLHQPVTRPNALRQLQYQFDLLHLRALE